ncbi:FkbM family methyltransferase [Pectobacterium aroidearum]|uniref:FkbM family methyltransferase n=1 Tax=Pectobacterium aroidearum TaxID=1201031 RepID=UPI0015DF83A7|nr:FkbM family methyltransferase [Pectobacterium aroidearum]MBA0204484.1 FkbM family methyltransferase [Pectobacterium aroidearum]
MALIDNIVERNNVFLSTIEMMKANGYPIVLCGAGQIAHSTYDFLYRIGIYVNEVAINRQYIKSNDLFHGRTLTPIESITKRDGKINYIISFQYVPDNFIKNIGANAACILHYDPAFLGIETENFIDYDFCVKNIDEFEWLNEQLNDSVSKETLAAFLNQRICAQTKYCSQLYDNNHYFPDSVINFCPDEVFVDCGAYNGDSVLAFLTQLISQDISRPRKIIAFEPDRNNFSLLEANVQQFDFCECINTGVWSHPTKLYFSSGRETTSQFSKKNENNLESIKVNSIDNVLMGGGATFIKMDIEGAELEALRGAEKTIKSCKPKLAISVYHKPDDLLKIPRYIKSLHHDYRFYLRSHHPKFSYELVLYAI